MSRREMMESSVDQNSEPEISHTEIREAVEELTTTVHQMVETLEAINKSDTSPHPKILEELDEIREQIANSQQTSNQTPAAEKLMATAEKLVEAAKTKEERANQMADQMESAAGKARATLRDVEKQTQNLQHAAKRLEDAPKSVKAEVQKARNKLNKPLRRLGLKAAGLVALTVVLVNAMLLGASVWLLSANDLSLTIQTEDERRERLADQNLGARVWEMRQNEWSEEERQQWEQMMNLNEEPMEAESSTP